MFLGEKYENIDLWNKIDDKYRELFNRLSTEFKKLCPKNIFPKELMRNKIVNLFKENNCYTQDVVHSKLIDKIMKLYEE